MGTCKRIFVIISYDVHQIEAKRLGKGKIGNIFGYRKKGLSYQFLFQMQYRYVKKCSFT